VNQPWEAERIVSPELARALVEDQFPDLAPTRVEPLGVGWDNTAYLVNRAYVFRFPRRPIAVDLITRFLAALHSIPPQGLDLPGDEIGRLDLARRLPEARARLEEIGQLQLVADPRPLPRILETASEAIPPRTGVLVHGDVYALHLLVDAESRVTGVIDWGDVHLGDPAVDLAVAHSFLPPSAHPAFLAHYGPVDEGTWHLARLRALHHCAAVVAYAHHTGSADLLREGLRALAHLTEPESAFPRG